jgi:hypothetical protein
MAMVLAALAGCVTRAEQTASQRDIVQLERAIEGSVRATVDPENFAADARDMIATPVNFHGVVMDEEGQPLPQAQIRAIVFDRLLEPFEYPYFGFTLVPSTTPNARGEFRLGGLEGAALYVLVSVDGYQPVTSPRRMYVYAEALDGQQPLPTPDAPAVFEFEPRPPAAELERIRTGALRLPGDGEPLPVAIRVIAPYGPAPEEIDAVVTCARELQQAGAHERFDWWCEIAVPDGGAQTRRLEFDQAPESGYESALRFGYHADDAAWDDRDNRELLLRFADGRYAYVLFQMRMDGDFYVAFDGVWNPSGSRWLD